MTTRRMFELCRRRLEMSRRSDTLVRPWTGRSARPTDKRSRRRHSQAAPPLGNHELRNVLLDNVGQNVAAIVDLLLVDVQRWEQTNHGRLRAIDEQLSLHAALHDG